MEGNATPISAVLKIVNWRIVASGFRSSAPDLLLPLPSPSPRQDCEDDSEDDGMKRERSLLLLSSLASEALDAVTGMSKVCLELFLRKINFAY